MKKLIFMMVAMLPMFFVACDKDETPKHEIVGLWELTKTYVDNRWVDDEGDLSRLSQLEFNNNYSGKFTYYSNLGTSFETFTWQVVDNQLRLILQGDKYNAYQIEQLGYTELILYRDEVVSYYKRVK
jgi:hypothetical protein